MSRARRLRSDLQDILFHHLEETRITFPLRFFVAHLYPQAVVPAPLRKPWAPWWMLYPHPRSPALGKCVAHQREWRMLALMSSVTPEPKADWLLSAKIQKKLWSWQKSDQVNNRSQRNVSSKTWQVPFTINTPREMFEMYLD